MVNASGALHRRILVFCKILYGFAICLNVFFAFTHVLQLFSFTFETKYLLPLGDDVVILLQSIVLYFLFSFAVKAHDLWLANDRVCLVPLKRMANGLFLLAGLDLLAVVYAFVFKVEYGKMSEGFYQSGHWLIPTMRFIEGNMDALSSATRYLTPRPMGIFGAMLGLFILYYLSANKNSAQR